jgi:hypothetical protein
MHSNLTKLTIINKYPSFLPFKMHVKLQLIVTVNPDQNPDPDPHSFGSLEPDPHRDKKLNLNADPQHCSKQDISNETEENCSLTRFDLIFVLADTILCCKAFKKNFHMRCFNDEFFSSLHLVHVFVVLEEGVPVGPAKNRP